MTNNPDKEVYPDDSDRQLRALISLFNWLVGEVVTARIMILRLAADLVRTGVLGVDEINGVPLSQEIIDSVMSNFPADPTWQSLGQRLRNSLSALRTMDLRRETQAEEEPLGDVDDLGRELEELEEAEDGGYLAGEPAQVLYHAGDATVPDAIFSRTSRAPGDGRN